MSEHESGDRPGGDGEQEWMALGRPGEGGHEIQEVHDVPAERGKA